MKNVTQKSMRCYLRFRGTADDTEISPEQHAETLRAIAEALHCASDEIRLIDTQEDGRLLLLEMPEELFGRFLKQGESDEQWLNHLGILLVKEILDDPYDISQIRRLLSKIFSGEELQSFCRQYFPDVSTKLSTGMKKAQAIDALLHYARQYSRISHILVLTEQRNAALFKKYQPYHLPARIFPAPTKSRVQRTASFGPSFFNLTVVEFFKASLLGSGLAAGLIFLLRRAMMAARDEFLGYLLYGGIALIGMFTGDLVLKITKHKRGRLLSIIGVGSYLFGASLGNALLWFTMMGFPLVWQMFPHLLFMGVLTSFSSRQDFLATLIGIFLAYRHTR